MQNEEWVDLRVVIEAFVKMGFFHSGQYANYEAFTSLLNPSVCLVLCQEQGRIQLEDIDYSFKYNNLDFQTFRDKLES